MLGMREDKRNVFIFVEIVEHCDEGAASHERVKPRLMTTITLDVRLHMFVVDVCVWL